MNSEDMAAALVSAMSKRFLAALIEDDFRNAVTLLGATAYLEEGDIVMASEWLDSWPVEPPASTKVGIDWGNKTDEKPGAVEIIE